MDCAFTFALVDEPDDGLSSLLHHERRAWGNAIISNECGRTLARVYLLSEFLDFNLIVINGNAGRCIGIGSESTLAGEYI
jgi:hypothetical protein